MKKLELLSPAGSYEGFIAALCAGADAVYAGGSKFGARAYAQNFTDEEMLRAIDVAHLYGKKLYMTVNTLCKEKEFDSLIKYMTPFYEAGLDGVIVQDLGIVSLFKEIFPDMPVHASTQMTITGLNGANFAKEMGMTRIVPARELSLSEIKYIHDNTDIEIETFIHGAMCYCYSGQCLFSGYLGGRSGNRGRCAQPCRLPYDLYENDNRINNDDEKYLLSMKDMSTLKILPDIIEAGVISFKIEGRMKKPEYTYLITSIYRKYIDMYIEKGRKGYKVDPKDYENLVSAYKRSDESSGYYKKYNGRELITLKKPSYETAVEKAAKYYILKPIAIELEGYFTEGQEAILNAKYEDVYVSVSGDICQSAQNRPMDVAAIEKQLCKLGQTSFSLKDISIELNGNIFIPNKSLNDLRRKAILELEEQLLNSYKRKFKETRPIQDDEPDKAGKVKLAVLCETKEQLQATAHMLSEESIKESAIYVESSILIEGLTGEVIDSLRQLHSCGVDIFLALPYIIRKKDQDKILAILDKIYDAGFFEGLLLRNCEGLNIARKYPSFKLIADFGLYSFNKSSCKALMDNGCEKLTIPLEINYYEMQERGFLSDSELVIYGRAPMMISVGCVKKTTSGCHEGSDLILYDRKRTGFPVISDCVFCYNKIYNSVPTSLHKDMDLIKKLKLSSLRIQFTNEDYNEVKEVLGNFIGLVTKGYTFELREYTRGHFKNSVE